MYIESTSDSAQLSYDWQVFINYQKYHNILKPLKSDIYQIDSAIGYSALIPY